jgi:hypothetical protein
MPITKEDLAKTFWGGMLRDAWGGLTLPGDVYAGRVDATSDEGIKRASDLAGSLFSGGMGRAAMSPMGEASLGMAGGRVPAALPEGVQLARKGSMYDITADGRWAGMASVAADGAKPFMSSVAIEPWAQRRGIGAALYDTVEKDIGRPLVPSPLGLTDEATAFWQKRWAGLPSDERKKLLDEATEIGEGYGLSKEQVQRRFEKLMDDNPKANPKAAPSPKTSEAEAAAWDKLLAAGNAL